MQDVGIPERQKVRKQEGWSNTTVNYYYRYNYLHAELYENLLNIASDYIIPQKAPGPQCDINDIIVVRSSTKY